MKNLLSSLVVIAGLLVCFSHIGEATQHGSLVLHFDFEEGNGEVEDMSGNGNTGIVKGGAEWTKDGKYGNAIHFDGTSGYVEVPDSPSLMTLDGADAQWTVECWVNTTDTGAAIDKSTCFIERRNLGDDSHWVFHLHIDGAGGASLFIGREAGATRKDRSSKAEVNDGDWHHIAATRDGTKSLKLYMDGVLEVEDSVDLDTIGSLTTIGARKTDAGAVQHYLEGTMDEVAIYNRVLSAVEINRDMIKGVNALVQPSGKLATIWSRIKSH